MRKSVNAVFLLLGHASGSLVRDDTGHNMEILVEETDYTCDNGGTWDSHLQKCNCPSGFEGKTFTIFLKSNRAPLC